MTEFHFEEIPIHNWPHMTALARNKIQQAIFHCDWRAAKYLAYLLKEKRLTEYVGEGTLYLLWFGTQLAGFIILAEKDGITDPAQTPWFSFLFVAPEFRGHRLGKRLIDHACNCAKGNGHRQVFLYTDHVDLYEKYDFTYLESKEDNWGDMSRIYVRIL